MTTTKTPTHGIDFNAPLEDLQGNPVTYNKDHGYITRDDGGAIHVGGGQTYQTVYLNPARDNLGWTGYLPFVRNRALDLTKPLQTRDGKRVEFLGTLNNGDLAVKVYYPWPNNAAIETRYPDGRIMRSRGESADDVIVKHVPKVTRMVRNIYADGTVGNTAHRTVEAAREYSKYGKIRVGYLINKYEDGELVGSRVAVATPQLRTAGNPTGYNPLKQVP